VPDQVEIEVRPIEAADVDGFVAVFESVAAEGRWIGTELPVDDARRARWRASAESPQGDAFTNVAVAGPRVVGFAHVDLDRGHAHLGMAVLDEFRGRGVGRRLLADCVAWARSAGAHKIDLEVWPHNTAARRLYEAAGFVVEGRRKRHWRRQQRRAVGLDRDEPRPRRSVARLAPYPDG
jgi:putative acetyltransferase